ncbi:MAG TPA: nuclear transport factor 2 family protein [Terriglobales bacterium]|nr:nuclear transport factor 2 family protein [Terriglobales bacterium]
MEDIEHAIEMAKTEFRNAYNDGDIPRLLNVLSEDFVDMSEGQASLFGGDARDELQARLHQLFSTHIVELQPIVIGVRGMDEWAFDYGWHKYILTPRSGGQTTVRRQRYLEIWHKRGGHWKLAIYMDSKEAEALARQFPSDVTKISA